MHSVEKNKQTIIPNFISESINSDECNEKGIFKIKGKLNSDLDDDLNFELPLAYPEEISATCSIKHGKKNTKIIKFNYLNKNICLNEWMI